MTPGRLDLPIHVALDGSQLEALMRGNTINVKGVFIEVLRADLKAFLLRAAAELSRLHESDVGAVDSAAGEGRARSKG